MTLLTFGPKKEVTYDYVYK